MGIVTLTTDLGYRDPYLAIVKARLLSLASSPQIIDLSCEIRENNISAAAFILRNSLRHFPSGAIHLVAVKAAVDRNRERTSAADNSRFLLSKVDDQVIITPDSGLFTLFDPAFNAPVYQLYYNEERFRHFFLKDIFVEVTEALLLGKPVTEIGTLTTEYYRAFQFEPYVQGNLLRGKGIYVDDFGNIITNITREKFMEIASGRNYTITLPGARLTKIHQSYDDVKYGAPLILFNSMDHLEVAVHGKSAFNLLCPRDIGSGFDFNLLIEFE